MMFIVIVTCIDSHVKIVSDATFCAVCIISYTAITNFCSTIHFDPLLELGNCPAALLPNVFPKLVSIL